MLLHVKRTILFLSLCAVIYFIFPRSNRSPGSSKSGRTQSRIHPPKTPSDKSFHILIPATKSDINLCKTVFSAAILGYPPPVILAWDQTIEPEKQEGLWGGGTHLFKVSKVLEWLQNLPPGRDNDLVMMMDGYDIWFQLRKDVLIERYKRINAAANRRIRKRMGRAAGIEGIEQTIIFASGKRCFPNEIHTVACWPLPPSPLYKDMWEGNTDTTIGSFPNQWSTTRQKFLNSGMIIGPARHMRALFERAAHKIAELGQDPEPDDNGSRWSEKVYHHSDQSVFNMIFGEQEYQREVMRIRHMSWLRNPFRIFQQFMGKDLSDTTATLEGNAIGNILNPPWSHATPPRLPGKPLEFGIGLDYWSQLAHQTANSERNGAWIKYSNKSLEAQIETKDRWDCKTHLEPHLPADILGQGSPLKALSDSSEETQTVQKRDNEDLSNDDRKKDLKDLRWTDVPLYTNICTGTIPVMLHMNGDKEMRERNWKDMWYGPHVQQLSQALKPQDGVSLLKGAENEGRQLMQPGSAFADNGKVLDFRNDLCKDWNLD